jgi:hypothetical protein
MSFRPERSSVPPSPKYELPPYAFDAGATLPPATPRPIDQRAKTVALRGTEGRREAPARASAEAAPGYDASAKALRGAVDRLSAAAAEADAVAEEIRDGKDDLLLYQAAMDEMPVEERDAWRQELLVAERSLEEADEVAERLGKVAPALERAKTTLAKTGGLLGEDDAFFAELAAAPERAETAASVARGWTEVGRRLMGDASRSLGALESRLRRRYADTIGRVGPEAFMRQRSSVMFAGLRAQAVEDFLKQHPERAPAKVPRQAPVARSQESEPSVAIAPEAMPQAAREYFQAHPELEAMKPSRPLPAERVRPQDRLPSVMVKPELGATTPPAERRRLFDGAKERLAQVRDAVADAKDSVDLLEYAAADAGSPEALAIYAPLRSAHGRLLERLEFSGRVLAAAEAGTLKLDDAPLEAQIASFMRGLEEIRQEQLALDREMHTHEGLVRRAYVEKLRKEGEAVFREGSLGPLKQPLSGLRAQAVEDYRKQEAAKPMARLKGVADRVRSWFRS